MVTLLLAFRLSTLFLLLLLAAGAIAVDPDGAAAPDTAVAPDTEAAALLRLKVSLIDPTNALEAWSPSSPSPPCDEAHRWPRVQCYNGVLIGLRLARLNLSGDFDFAALSRLPGLHSINLIRNNFSGPLPASLAAVRSLRALYLSRNAFSGPVPGDVFAAMSWLKKLYLDRNNFSGELPAGAIAGAPRLQELHLDHNRIEGRVPVFVVMGIIMLVVLLVAGAMVLMLRQDEGTSTASSGYEHPAIGAPSGNLSVPHAAGAAASAQLVTMEQGGSGGGVGGVGGARKQVAEFVLMSNAAGEFGLPELMKASAEVLGNGTLGSAYKAAMRNGVTVAVKRMRDMNRVGRAEFEEHIRMLGELRHPNVLSPVGYHYRKEEKLIVSEFMPRGSLLYVLHGDQSPDRVVLDWPARMRIAVGVVRGLSYLHEKLGIPAMRLVSMTGADFDAPPPPPPHGNLKSGNILLDAHLEPRIVDYGFFPLVNTSQAPHAMFAFRSPEAASAAGAGAGAADQRAALSARSDVYCLEHRAPRARHGEVPVAVPPQRRAAATTSCSGRRRRWAAAPSQEVDDPVVAGGAGPGAVRLMRVGVRRTIRSRRDGRAWRTSRGWASRSPAAAVAAARRDRADERTNTVQWWRGAMIRGARSPMHVELKRGRILAVDAEEG
ncbi:hypothetical protein OsI_36867 [Oryza sativa Indica Group]|uniref:Protein kinase domain-containing protein n=1 Tax=Oryza sativa subsp. indica TaxID=39946 RepID=B8BLM1_ORYSI|nr:hypothetical protein OsI_36867 [Oryza sativa Indica Group]